MFVFIRIVAPRYLNRGVFIMSEFEFSRDVTPARAIEAVRSEGACAIRKFLLPEALAAAAADLARARMSTDDTTEEGQVHRRHDLVRYDFSVRHHFPINLHHDSSEAPVSVYDTAHEVAGFVRQGDPSWQPNEVMGHRYNTGDYINKHRDYASALGYVAVLTLEGSQEFYFQRDSEQMARVRMEPGTLTLLRGAALTGRGKRRPYHGVERAKGQRLALSLRHMRSMAWD
jgi:alkylated DNA repair dioxygenase AlkB